MSLCGECQHSYYVHECLASEDETVGSVTWICTYDNCPCDEYVYTGN